MTDPQHPCLPLPNPRATPGSITTNKHDDQHHDGGTAVTIDANAQSSEQERATSGATHPVATTALGALRGLDRGGHLAFLGVRFADSPARERRFTAPTPVSSWTGIVDAGEYAPAAPQDPFVPFPFRAAEPESEDCLFLNVYTPSLDDRRRPVLFWIHGGGFSHGSGKQPQYDGGPLAERGDVVVVTINYRVGALGYLYLGGHDGGAWEATDNAGQRDQVAALAWVREHISAFGGDPDNVTIFGQSAGGVAVSTLLGMPSARHYFHKAIAQSGTANRLGDTTYASTVAGQYLERLGIPDADPDRLRTVDVADIVRAQGPRGPLSPVVDGVTIPTHPLHAVRDGAVADVAMMIGTARDEQKLYVDPKREPIDDATLVAQVAGWLPARSAERAGEVADTYRDSRRSRGLPSSNLDLADAVATASRFRIPATRLAEAQRAHQERTFVYQIDWESPARRGALGACHGIEIPFVFGTIGRTGDDRMTGSGPDADVLSGHMMDAWIAFARTGDPSHGGIGAWAPYDSQRRTTMIFGRECGAIEAPFEEERAIWASVLAR